MPRNGPAATAVSTPNLERASGIMVPAKPAQTMLKIIALASTNVLLGGKIHFITRTEGWNAVQQAFFSPPDFKEAWPKVVDGFWLNVKMFLIAEPVRNLGKFTFADALDAKFNSRGIKLAAGISTLAVSVFYLIPQMVGAGVLVTPLLGLPHWAGVVLVGVIVILIVVTAGMVSIHSHSGIAFRKMARISATYMSLVRSARLVSPLEISRSTRSRLTWSSVLPLKCLVNQRIRLTSSR